MFCWQQLWEDGADGTVQSPKLDLLRKDYINVRPWHDEQGLTCKITYWFKVKDRCSILYWVVMCIKLCFQRYFFSFDFYYTGNRFILGKSQEIIQIHCILSEITTLNRLLYLNIYFHFTKQEQTSPTICTI